MTQAIAVVGVFCFLLCLYASSVAPELLIGLLTSMLCISLVVLLFVAACLGFTRWRRTSRLWMVPSMVCLGLIICVYFAFSLGNSISDRRFKNHLADYSKVVDGFKDGTLSCLTPCNSEFEMIKVTNRPERIGQVRGVHCDDGGAIVLFWVYSDVPLLHTGYIFKGYGEESNCNKVPIKPENQWYIWPISGQWYHFSD